MTYHDASVTVTTKLFHFKYIARDIFVRKLIVVCIHTAAKIFCLVYIYRFQFYGIKSVSDVHCTMQASKCLDRTKTPDKWT